MATRLKRLDLQGFKSFANPTSFVFDTGITAVIGPNGSGKSNISDGLRWVLGEQSYSNLRGRRTEDIIFAGSTARSPLGMAEVTVTLDNEDGSLPLAFSEISVTRRAFRSGENQYLINGARVRLKDVLQVTASLGQSYTVIGQGLVDAVLSQKVDERRGLFEHAAGITGLRLKHAEASRSLAESQANCTRLEDLLADVEPRLRSLERAARQAREYDDVRRQLRSALMRFYAFYWRQSQRRLAEATATGESAAAALESALTAREKQQAAVARARALARERTEAVEARRVEIDGLRDEQRRIEHELALIDERRSASRDRRADATRTLQALQSSSSELGRDGEALTQSLETLQTEIVETERQVAELESAGLEARRERARLESQLTRLEQERLTIERALLTKENRNALLRAQTEQLESEQTRIRDEADERGKRDAALQSQRVEAERTRNALAERLTAMQGEQQALSTEIASAVRGRRLVLDQVAEHERQFVSVGTRLDALKRLEESGVGLYTGVKQVLDAVRRKELVGVLGTLSSLLIVPGELEAAIEAALGGHLQDLVVERWVDAEQAIDYLKRKQAGRATFQPLDTVVSHGNRRVPRSTPGVRGVAADLIDVDERARAIVDSLLARTLVAENLDAARVALAGLAAGWSIVTLGGEIARSNGTVTGGSRVKESGALARVRELRELPRQRERLKAERDRAAAALARFDTDLSTLQERKSRLDSMIESARAEARQLAATGDQIERWLDDLRRAATTDSDRSGQLSQKMETIHRELTELAVARMEDEAALRRLAGEVQQLQQIMVAATEMFDDEKLRTARDELTRQRERVRNLEEQRQRFAVRARNLREQSIASERRVSELQRDIERLDAEGVAASNGQVASAIALERARVQFSALESEHRVASEAARLAQDDLNLAENQCRDLEREHDRLVLDIVRRRDELELSLERATRDLEVDEITIETELSQSDVAASEDLPRLEREIARNRERLRRIGVAGEDAIEQYEREAERTTFLRQQLTDIRIATDALRALMNELDRTMALAFDETFSEVARAFEGTFTALFGGGKARLVRCNEGDGATGIDIVAQPPGKRLQSLGLLSGGERALTAVALLFSILKVNPSPFCLLDEVDAALDEANVVRLRDELKLLAEKTQFVVVTHNRATIEGADTLYGITMGDDGISRTLSLRLPAEVAD